MKQIVLKYGLICGGIMAGMFVLTWPFKDRIGFDNGLILGYTTIVLAMLMVFFGVRAYRDSQADRQVSFGRALAVGLLISLVASSIYVATWEVMYYTVAGDFAEKYSAYAIEKARSSGASVEEIAAKTAEIQRNMELYKNPLYNIAFTFLEPFPVALIASFVTALILRRRRNPADAAAGGLAAVSR